MSTFTTSTRSKRPLLIAVALGVVLALGAGIWYFFIRDDAPAAFDIDTAAESASQDDGAGPDGADTTDTTGASSEEPEGVDGVWSVDPSAGADAGGPMAGFRVAEELVTIGATEAVGRTAGVTGNVTIEGTTVSAVEITVDMGSLMTDESRRDGRMHDALATDEFPTSTFVLTEPIELGAIPTEGETITVTAIGDLTIRGVTKPVQIELDARLVSNTLVVVGATPVAFADYGVEPPTAPIVLSVADEGTIEFQLFLTRS